MEMFTTPPVAAGRNPAAEAVLCVPFWSRKNARYVSKARKGSFALVIGKQAGYLPASNGYIRQPIATDLIERCFLRGGKGNPS